MCDKSELPKLSNNLYQKETCYFGIQNETIQWTLWVRTHIMYERNNVSIINYVS